MSPARFSRPQGHPRRLLLGAALLFAAFAATAAGAAGAPALPDPSRGELLYATHCVTCHNVDVHWRGKRLVTDRDSLMREVRRWQEASGLGWSEDDVAEVARYLNLLYYSHPAPQ